LLRFVGRIIRVEKRVIASLINRSKNKIHVLDELRLTNELWKECADFEIQFPESLYSKKKSAKIVFAAGCTPSCIFAAKLSQRRCFPNLHFGLSILNACEVRTAKALSRSPFVSPFESTTYEW
jgi:hypothetical protein